MEAVMGLATTIKQWRIDWKRTHELEALGPDGREALARDIGISEDVLGRLVARGPEAGAELPRLMAALSLDADRITRAQAAVMRDMSITCSQCMVAARCRRDLDHELAPSAHRNYCPNAETLRELRH
jgi:hypothetical protein